MDNNYQNQFKKIIIIIKRILNKINNLKNLKRLLSPILPFCLILKFHHHLILHPGKSSSPSLEQTQKRFY